MECQSPTEAVCQAIGDRLKELAVGLSEGVITEQNFTELVLKLEAEAVTPHGFVLTASNTIDNWTVFKLRHIGHEETCATFEFLPETGEFRRAGSGPP